MDGAEHRLPGEGVWRGSVNIAFFDVCDPAGKTMATTDLSRGGLK